MKGIMRLRVSLSCHPRRVSAFYGIVFIALLSLSPTVLKAQTKAEWAKAPGTTSGGLAFDGEHEMLSSSAAFDNGKLVVITHWKRKTESAMGLAAPHVITRCLDAYDDENSFVSSTCYIPLKL